MPGAGAARRGAALRRAAGLGGPASPGPTPHGPFWLILDSLGGSALGAALGMLQPGGTCVTFGVSEAASTAFESRDFFGTGRGPPHRGPPGPHLMNLAPTSSRPPPLPPHHAPHTLTP